MTWCGYTNQVCILSRGITYFLLTTALNVAIQGGKRWAPELAAGVFDKAVQVGHYLRHVQYAQANQQLMEDYATLSRAKGDPGLENQLASGYFAVLSGKIFELRDMEQGDEKVCSDPNLRTDLSLSYLGRAT
jgi:hypothetical protein